MSINIAIQFGRTLNFAEFLCAAHKIIIFTDGAEFILISTQDFTTSCFNKKNLFGQ